MIYVGELGKQQGSELRLLRDSLLPPLCGTASSAESARPMRRSKRANEDDWCRAIASAGNLMASRTAW